MTGKVRTLHGNGMNVRDWLHVSDHCRGLLLALVKGRPGTVYNFGGECERTNLHIAHMLQNVMNKQDSVGFIQDRAGNDGRYSTNISHARQALDWEPGPSIEHRIADVVKWYMDNPNYGEEYGR
jgi:dTDP-glucose 4,6-dehydratase